MIRQKQKSDKIIIDLDGPEGNAYNLIGVANNLMRKGLVEMLMIEILQMC